MSSNALSIKVNIDYSTLSKNLEDIKKKVDEKDLITTSTILKNVAEKMNEIYVKPTTQLTALAKEIERMEKIINKEYIKYLHDYGFFLNAFTNISFSIMNYTNLLSSNIIETINASNSKERYKQVLDVLEEEISAISDLGNEKIEVDTVNKTISVADEIIEIKDVEKAIKPYYNEIMNNINEIKQNQHENKEQIIIKMDSNTKSSNRIAKCSLIITGILSLVGLVVSLNPDVVPKYEIKQPIINEIQLKEDIKNDEIIDENYNDFIICQNEKGNSTNTV